MDEWKQVEQEDFEGEGYVIMRSDGKGYMAPSPTELFAFEDAKQVIEDLMRKGMPIGAAKVVKARLAHHRKMEYTDLPAEEPRSSLIVLPGGKP